MRTIPAGTTVSRRFRFKAGGALVNLAALDEVVMKLEDNLGNQSSWNTTSNPTVLDKDSEGAAGVLIVNFPSSALQHDLGLYAITWDLEYPDGNIDSAPTKRPFMVNVRGTGG